MSVLSQVAVVSSFLIALYFSVVLIFHNVLTNYNSHSFQFGTVRNSPVTNTLEYVFVWAALFIWFECTLRGGNAGPKNVCFAK